MGKTIVSAWEGEIKLLTHSIFSPGTYRNQPTLQMQPPALWTVQRTVHSGGALNFTYLLSNILSLTILPKSHLLAFRYDYLAAPSNANATSCSQLKHKCWHINWRQTRHFQRWFHDEFWKWRPRKWWHLENCRWWLLNCNPTAVAGPSCAVQILAPLIQSCIRKTFFTSHHFQILTPLCMQLPVLFTGKVAARTRGLK